MVCHDVVTGHKNLHYDNLWSGVFWIMGDLASWPLSEVDQ